MKNKSSDIANIRRQEIYNDPDLCSIICRRVLVRLNVMYYEISKTTDGKGIYLTKEEFEEKVKPILLKEIASFIQYELMRYKKRNRSDYLIDIEKAREGSDSSLFKILRWDKVWLKMPWVIEKIFQAQDTDDFKFLKSAGDAIARQPGSSTKPKETEENINLVETLRILFDILDIQKQDTKIIKELHARLYDADTIDNTKVDFKYFVKWLSRHKII